MSTFDRVLSSEPIDWLARVVTSDGFRYKASRGWGPGAFSRVRVPFVPGKLSGKTGTSHRTGQTLRRAQPKGLVLDRPMQLRQLRHPARSPYKPTRISKAGGVVPDRAREG